MQASRLQAAAWFLFIMVVALVGCDGKGDSWERIAANGVLRVGLDPTYPPFEVADDDGVRGLDVDLARALAGDLGLEAEFVYFGYDGLYDALSTGQVDVLLSALVVMPERTRDFAYSEPYFNAGEVLIVPAGSGSIERMADLNGHTLAVELGARGHVEATAWEKRLPDLTVRSYPSPDEALTAVANGAADAALIDSVSGRLFVAGEPRLQRAPTPVTVEPYAIVVRIEDEILLARLNQSLAHLAETGELDEIIARWLGP